MYEVVNASTMTPGDALVWSEVHQGVTIAHISIASIKDKQAALLRQSLLALAKERRGRVALDLSGVTDFTCAWINVMLELTRACRRDNWDLAVYGLQGPTRSILKATQLDRKMTLCPNRDEALGKLGIQQPTLWERLVGGGHAEQPSAEPLSQAA